MDVPSTSHMAYLRDRYITEKALMRKSKTDKSYDSLFGRWSSWCREQSSDLIFGPITEVMNVLADLHKHGWVPILFLNMFVSLARLCVVHVVKEVTFELQSSQEASERM